MASTASIAGRRADVVKRQEAVSAWLADHLGIEIPPPSERVRQPELQEVLNLERVVIIQERIREAFEAKASGGVDPTILSGTIADIKGQVAGITDLASLRLLRAAEAGSDKPRAGAIGALDARIGELEAEEVEE